MRPGGLVGALLFVAGCGHTSVHEVVLRPGGPPLDRRPEAYFGEQRPVRRSSDVALLQAIGTGSDANIEDVSEALLKRGRQLGCDAVVSIRVDLGGAMAHGFGVCVRYVEGP